MPEQTSEMARAIQDVTEKAQLLVREEIALAKAEVGDKASKLIKGAIFGIVAAVFLVFALIFLLHALALGISSLLGSDTWVGYLIVGVLLIVLGAIGGLIARRLVKRGSPPMPQMAIEEAQLIKGTLTASQPAEPVGAVGARQAPTPAPRGGGR